MRRQGTRGLGRCGQDALIYTGRASTTNLHVLLLLDGRGKGRSAPRALGLVRDLLAAPHAFQAPPQHVMSARHGNRCQGARAAQTSGNLGANKAAVKRGPDGRRVQLVCRERAELFPVLLLAAAGLLAVARHVGDGRRRCDLREGRKEGRTEGQTDGRTDGRTEEHEKESYN